jgi:hypothetical protein
VKILCALAAFIILSAPAPAEVKVPKGSFFIEKYDQAIEQAKEQKKPLVVVFYNEIAIGGDDESIVAEAFKSVTGLGVIVAVTLARGREELNSLPPPLFTAIAGRGGPIHTPLVMLCAPTEDIVWKVMAISGDDLKLARKIFHGGVAEVKPAIAAHFAAKPTPSMVHPGDKSLLWPGLMGKVHRGAFARVAGEQLFLKNEDGALLQPIGFDVLQPAAVRYAKTVAALNAPPAASASAADKPSTEKWTNSKGKEIEAGFVKLADGKVTLRLTSGKTYTLPLTDLSVASQARAEQLADETAK